MRKIGKGFYVSEREPWPFRNDLTDSRGNPLLRRIMAVSSSAQELTYLFVIQTALLRTGPQNIVFYFDLVGVIY